MDKTLLNKLETVEKLKALAPFLSDETKKSLQQDEMNMVVMLQDSTGMTMDEIYKQLLDSLEKPTASERIISVIKKFSPYVPSFLKALWNLAVHYWPQLATGTIGAVASYIITTYC